HPPFSEVQTVKAQPKPAKGDVVLYLSAFEFPSSGGGIVWQRPRLVKGTQPPLLLRDYARFGGRYEIDLRSVFERTAEYLDGAREASTRSVAEIARERSLDAGWLKRWVEILALEPQAALVVDLEKMAPAAPVELLDTE